MSDIGAAGGAPRAADTPAPPAPGSVPVTVVIAARDEEANIAGCVDSVRWAAEVIVAEHGSADATARVAREAGARVVSEPAATIGAQRNAAVARASYPWVLVVDADERATAALGAEVAGLVGTALAPVGAEAYRVPRRNFFLGREIRHGGWERDRPVRLFRSTLRYDDSKVHERVVVAGDPSALRGALLHYPYPSLDRYFEKFDRYSRWWADQQFERGRRTSAAALVVKPPARFLKMYFLHRGFLDGAHGVVLASLAAASVLAKYARLWGRQCAS